MSVRKRSTRKQPNAFWIHMPLLESLEQKCLLTSVIGHDPPANSHETASAADISASFDSSINRATASADTFAVHAMQTGRARQSPSVNGDTIKASLTSPLHAGELVQVTIAQGLENPEGESLLAPYVWQFRAAAKGGTGLLDDSGERLGGLDNGAVALGDLDGDGDLDALLANGDVGDAKVDAIWLNDGGGRFTDSGQSPSFGSSKAISLGDLDGDGDLDAFVGTQSYTPDEVWINDNGRFTERDQEMPNGYTHSAALADVDGDGDLDAFLEHSGRSNTVWLNRDADTTRLPGDSNHDQRFDQADIVVVLQAAKYRTGESANFEEGDWNGDRVFNQRDIVVALQLGDYMNTASAAQAVDAIFQ